MMPPVTTQRIICAPPERSEGMRPSRSRLALLLSLMLLAGLVGCGQTSPDSAPISGSRISTSGTAARDLGQGSKILSPTISSATQAGTPLGKGTAQARESIDQEDKLVLKPESEPNGETDGRDNLSVAEIPESIAKDLDSPDAFMRLQAMNHWDTQGIKAPLDPLFAALDDEDGRVRIKATEIIERYYAIEQEQGRTE